MRPTRPIYRSVFTVFACLLAAAAGAGSLVSYSFDDQRLDTGPDTLRIFEYSRGTARLSSTFRYSGYYSVEIRDAADDGGFPELQGFFPMQYTGTVHVHFAFMTPTPEEPFNIALAGPRWFRMSKDGIGFWLKNKHGYFYQVTDHEEQQLVPITPYTWYLVDLAYHVEEGRYDLRIREEQADEWLVDRQGVANTTASRDSKVYVFSFIGDLPDKANAVIYVDDIDIRTDQPISTQALIAPGRRKLFIDSWKHLQRDRRSYPQCIPTTGLEDFAIDTTDLAGWQSQEQFGHLQTLLRKRSALSDAWVDSLDGDARLQAIGWWRLGCRALDAKDPDKALGYFMAAEAAVPGARMYSLSAALALAALSQFDDVDARIASAYGLWSDDDRFAAAQAMIGLAREELWQSEQVLQLPASVFPGEFGDDPLDGLWSDGLDENTLKALRKQYPNDWQRYLRERLITEQYYYLLLWRGAYADGYRYAERVSAHLRDSGRLAGAWLEYQGNAAFLMGDYPAAEQAYQLALADNVVAGRRSHSVYLKLSDLYYSLGDADRERLYREKVYGSLRQ